MAKKYRPQRSCAACRQKKDKRALTRLVIANDSLQMDSSGKMKGRGAYLCDKPACWALAAQGPVLGKALRRPLTTADRDYLRQLIPA